MDGFHNLHVPPQFKRPVFGRLPKFSCLVYSEQFTLWKNPTQFFWVNLWPFSLAIETAVCFCLEKAEGIPSSSSASCPSLIGPRRQCCPCRGSICRRSSWPQTCRRRSRMERHLWTCDGESWGGGKSWVKFGWNLGEICMKLWRIAGVGGLVAINFIFPY